MAIVTRIHTVDENEKIGSEDLEMWLWGRRDKERTVGGKEKIGYKKRGRSIRSMIHMLQGFGNEDNERDVTCQCPSRRQRSCLFRSRHAEIFGPFFVPSFRPFCTKNGLRRKHWQRSPLTKDTANESINRYDEVDAAGDNKRTKSLRWLRVAARNYTGLGPVWVPAFFSRIQFGFGFPKPGLHQSRLPRVLG